jgi:UDP-N-acetylglucosamine acyltransferase
VTRVHPSAIVSPHAELGSDVEIGPHCVIESETRIGDGCRMESFVVVKQATILGPGNYLAEGVVLGGLPQHKRAVGQPGRLIIGAHNAIREHVTIHRGLTAHDETTLGDNNLLMVNAHVAHDCHVGNHVILANNVMLAGHVTVGDRAYLSGAAAVHQYCRIGAFAMVGGQAHITKDVPPFVTVDGLSSMIVGLNTVGLRRAGFDREDMLELKRAYRLAFRSGLRWTEMLELLRVRFPRGHAASLCQFMSQTARGCIQERSLPKRATLKLRRDAAATDESSDREAGQAPGEPDRKPRRAA